MGLRDDPRRYLKAIDDLARRRGRAVVSDLAQETNITFGKACAIVSRLSRDQLVRHLPHSGIFMTDRGRAHLAHVAA